MVDRVGEEFAALVISTTKYGMFVELADLFIEGLVPIETLPGERYYVSREYAQDRGAADAARVFDWGRGAGDLGSGGPGGAEAEVFAGGGGSGEEERKEGEEKGKGTPWKTVDCVAVFVFPGVGNCGVGAGELASCEIVLAPGWSIAGDVGGFGS